MTTTDILSKGVYYHTASGSRDTAARWTQGAARKGVYDGRETLSAVIFDAEEIAQAIGEDPLIGAELILSRDTGFGESTVTVCLAPMQLSELPDRYMRRSECIALSHRKLRRCYSIEGASAVFGIPGAQLMELRAGEANAFLLYQDEDGSDSYCRLSDTATLRLYTGNDWMAPVWLRTLSAGDVISGPGRSHIADLRELEFYINRRRVYDNLEPMADIGEGLDLGLYRDWPAVILKLQAGVDGIVAAEGRAAHTWIVPGTGLPQAAVIEELKTIMNGEEESSTPSLHTYYTHQSYTRADKAFNPDAATLWTEGKAMAGMVKTQQEMTDQGHTFTITAYDYHTCCWSFEWEEGIVMNSAAVRIKVKSISGADTVHVVLRGMRLKTVPTDEYHRTKYQSVMDDTVFGEADCPAGEETRIPISAAGLKKLNAGSAHGVGIRYDLAKYTEFDPEAYLMINNETSEESEEA